MFRRFLLLSFACAASVAPAAPVPPEDEHARLGRTYGVWESPDRDCRYALRDGALRVSLPASDVLLGTTRQGSIDNAPRVLREVEGDFVASVRVSVLLVEGKPRGDAPYRAGGIVAWESETEYFVVRRRTSEADGDREAVWSHHRRTNGNTVWEQGVRKTEGTTFLRLYRTGEKVVAGWSRDGKVWKDFGAEEVAWGTTVKVGVVAENCLGTATEITFDQYSLTRGKK